MSFEISPHRYIPFDPTSKKVGPDGLYYNSDTSSIGFPWAALQSFMANHAYPREGPLQPSPFESPLGVSSMGSPNSSRDFDEPLITGSEEDTPFDQLPLFEQYGKGVDGTSDAASPLQDDAGWSFSYADFIPADTSSAVAATNITPAGKAIGVTHLTGAQYFPVSQPSMAVFDTAAAAFAALQDIAPASTLNGEQPQYELPAKSADNIHRRLSLSDSVSGYSSSQESVPIRDANSLEASQYSVCGTPDCTLDSKGGDEIRHLATILVQQLHACGRDARNTSEIVLALKTAGIEVEPTLMAAKESRHSPEALCSPTSSVCSQSHSHSHRQSSVGLSDQDTWSDASSPQAFHEEEDTKPARKSRSSVHVMAKYNAIGASASASAFEEFDTVMKDGKRHFRCDVCHKLFDRAFNMKTHRIIHESHREQPFACPFDECGKRFSRKADCNRHTKSVHLRKGQALNGRPLAVVVDVG